jgi:hypothetical protein
MASFLKAVPAGIPGSVSRPDLANIEPAMLKAVSSVFAQAYGIPMAYVAGGISQFQGSNVAADFAGLLVREAPGISANTQLQGLNDNTPYPSVPQGLMVRGYMTVLCTIGTPARGGIVYIRTVAASGKAIGDLEATSDPGNNVALSAGQAEWASDGKDANNNAEIRVSR